MRRNGRPMLPHSPMEGVGRPEFQSAPANPLTQKHQAAIDSLELSLTERCAWHLLYGHGWRPVSCRELTIANVREVASRGDGYIRRIQKKRLGKASESRAPILPESLTLLRELSDEMVKT